MTYRIKNSGGQFIVFDSRGEQVDSYPTKDAARQDVKDCKEEDAMYETGKLLVDIAIKAHMRMYGVDRKTARYWIQSASDIV